MWAEIAELSSFFLLSGVKFLPCPFAIIGLGFSYWVSVFVCMGGGMLGMLIFYYASEVMMKRSRAKKLAGTNKLKAQGKYVPRPVFTRTNKTIVKVKKRFGIIGIAILTPPILSIPIGAVISAKFFKHNPYTIFVLLAAVAFWALTLSYIAYISFG